MLIYKKMEIKKQIIRKLNHKFLVYKLGGRQDDKYGGCFS